MGGITKKVQEEKLNPYLVQKGLDSTPFDMNKTYEINNNVFVLTVT